MDREPFVELPPCAVIGTVLVVTRGGRGASTFRSFGDADQCSPNFSDNYSTSNPVDCPCNMRTNRLSCRLSDCDSDVNSRRPHRTKFLWRRYDNVFAATCLLLVIAGLLQHTSAAPLVNKKMDRTKRDTIQEENSLWSNPCDYNNVKDVPVLEYNPNRANNIVISARLARDKAAEYRDDFAVKIHSYKYFETLLSEWEGREWLRNYSWMKDEALPKIKKLNASAPDEYISDMMERIDEVLPVLYKSVKMVVAALDSMQREGFKDQPTATLQGQVVETMHHVRVVLCQFNELMTSRKLSIPPIETSDIPRFDNSAENKEVMLLLVYRDAMNLMEYVAQVFHKMSEQ